MFGFFKAHHKITPRVKSGRGPGLRELPKIWGYPIITFLHRLKVATSRLAGRWALPMPITKSHPEESGRGHGLGSSQKIWGFPLIFLQRLKLATSNLVCSLGLPRPIIKSHPEEKWAWPWARGAPQNWGFPINVSATTEGSEFKIGRLVGFAHPEEEEGLALG